MKTKIDISYVIFSKNDDLEVCYQLYEKYYKQHNFILDKEREEVYIVFDEPFNFIEGDRVQLFGFTGIVSWKLTDITKRLITYALVEE